MIEPRLLDLLPRYEAALRGLGRRPGGIANYVYTMARFVDWCAASGCPDPTPAALTRGRILDYRDHLGATRRASSIIAELSVLASFCAWLVERDLLLTNPVDGVARPRKGDRVPNPLTVRQVELLLAAIAMPDGLVGADAYLWRRNRRIIYLMLFAGFRRSDCLVVRWQHIDVQRQMVQLEGNTKGGKPRRVALHPELMTELLGAPLHERVPDFAVCGLPTGEPLSRGGIEHVFDRWLEVDLRIDDILGTHLHPHKLRATFATFFAWSGGSVLTLQQLLGHSDPKTTMGYVLTDDEEKRRQIQKLRFDFTPPDEE